MRTRLAKCLTCGTNVVALEPKCPRCKQNRDAMASIPWFNPLREIYEADVVCYRCYKRFSVERIDDKWVIGVEWPIDDIRLKPYNLVREEYEKMRQVIYERRKKERTSLQKRKRRV